MITNLSITSLSQGQIFGAKPSMEEFERQLEADPTYKAYDKLCAILAAFGSNLQVLRRAGWRPTFTFQKHHNVH